MQVRDNIRERRRNRIMQLTGVRPESRRSEPETIESPERGAYSNEELPEERIERIKTSSNLVPSQGARLNANSDSEAASQEGSLTALNRWLDSADSPEVQRRLPAAAREPRDSFAEQDPEKWWKERQRMQFSNRKPIGNEDSIPAGMGSIKSLSDFPNLSRGGSDWREGPAEPPHDGGWSRFIRGFMMRAAIALLLLGAAWAWFRFELPGSGQAKAWTVQAITRDMDYVAVQEWYERTFGSTPAFLELLNRPDNTEAVSADWNREEIALPLTGTIVQPFEQDGTGIRMSAPAGSPVKAVHTGRVTQVTLDEQGIATIQIQHPNRVVSVYGNVDNVVVKANDWVETGAKLGEAAALAAGEDEEGGFYFALKRDGKFLDPTEVIPFD
jgi:Membrane-bound metallopeptidase